MENWWNNPANFDLQDQSQPIPQPRLRNSPHRNRGQVRFNRHDTSNILVPPEQSNGFMTKHAGEKIRLKFRCFSLCFYMDYENQKELEYSNKIIAPTSVIQKLSQYGNIPTEYIFQINNDTNRVTIGDYFPYNSLYDYNDCIYVPSQIFDGLNIENGDDVNFDFINTNIPSSMIAKGTKTVLQPLTDKFNNIEDVQVYLQEHIQKYYTCLTRNNIIKIPYFEDEIIMIIIETEPADIISVTDTDLIVDFKPSVESLSKPKPKPKPQPLTQEPIKEPVEEIDNSYPGKGHVLGTSNEIFKWKYCPTGTMRINIRDDKSDKIETGSDIKVSNGKPDSMSEKEWIRFVRAQRFKIVNEKQRIESPSKDETSKSKQPKKLKLVLKKKNKKEISDTTKNFTYPPIQSFISGFNGQTFQNFLTNSEFDMDDLIEDD